MNRNARRDAGRYEAWALVVLFGLVTMPGYRSASAQPPPAEPRSESTASRRRDLPLRRFKPRSNLVLEEHILTRAKFPVVNVHTHPGRFKSPQQVDRMIQTMDACNIAVSVSLDGYFGQRLSDHIKLLTERYPDRFVVFARIDSRGDGDPKDQTTWAMNRPGFGEHAVRALENAIRRGARGLKVSKALGLYWRDEAGRLIAPDDARFDPIWAKCGQLGIPVLIHVADPAAFFKPLDETNERYEELSRHPNWHFYGKGYPTRDALLRARDRIIARHPKTIFIGAHMANNPEDLAYVGRLLDEHENLYVEIAARINELGRQPYTARKFFLKYQDRILFGTDGVPPVSELGPHFRFLETYDEYFPYEDNEIPPQGLWNIYGIGLPDEVLEKVYHKNAMRLIGGLHVQPTRTR